MNYLTCLRHVIDDTRLKKKQVEMFYLRGAALGRAFKVIPLTNQHAVGFCTNNTHKNSFNKNCTNETENKMCKKQMIKY